MLPVFAVLIIIVKVILSFSLLILIHEFGHFIAAKKSGVWVEEFGLGLPPRIFGKKIGNTIYSINWLPIGGFVHLHGETSSDKVTYPDKAFTNKSKLTKIFITLAGIFMNFVLAVVCFSIVFFFSGIPGKINLTIIGVTENSPSQAAGFQKDDILEKINDKKISTDSDFKNEVEANKGKSINLEIKRNGKDININVIPRINPPAGEGALGIAFTDIQEVNFPPIWQRPFVSAWYGLRETFDVSKAVVFGLGSAAKSVSQGQAPSGISGPVGIIALVKRFAEIDMLTLISFVGLISVNLAIINLIPFPPLDGSRVALVVAEWITKKKMTAKMEERVYLIGFLILIGMTILITAHDIPNLIKAGSLDKYADSLLNGK